MELIKRMILFVFIAVFSSGLLASQPQIDELMKGFEQEQYFNGNVLVGKGSEVIYARGFGVADVAAQIPNTLRTRFNLASITKQFTAATIMLLIRECKLRLNDTISDYLPYYRSDTGAKITIHQLLNHSSGLASFGKDKRFMQHEASVPVTTGNFIKSRCSDDLIHPPGSDYLYSNSGYYILGAIIEAVTKMSFGDAVQHYIFEPLGMKDSGFEVNLEDKNHAIGYRQTTINLIPAPKVHPTVSYSAGGLYSTVEDLLKWNIALYSGKLIPKQILDVMLSPSIANYGYGVKRYRVNLNDGTSQVFYGHGGSLIGFNNFLAYLPESEYSVVVLSNTDTSSSDIAKAIIKSLLDIPITTPKASTSEQLISILLEGKTEQALRRYRELLRISPKNALNVRTLTEAGRKLFDDGKYDAARKVFTFNASQFPRYCLNVEWIGKTYLAQEMRDQAIFYFKQATEISQSCDDSIRFLTMVGEMPTNKTTTTIPLASLEFGKYIGRYRMSKNRVLEITFEDEKLYAKPDGQKRVLLEPLTSTLFNVMNTPAKLEFLINDEGVNDSIRLIQRGRSKVGEKID